MNLLSKIFRKPALPVLTSAQNIKLTGLEISLIQHVYNKYKQIIVEKEFGGGYTGTRVFLILPITTDGRSDAYMVTKVGSKTELKEEKQNYEKYVKTSLPFSTAQVREYYDEANQAALNYVFAGGGVLGTTLSLEEYYRQHSAAEIKDMLVNLLDRELGPQWYAQSHPLHCLFSDQYGRYLPPHQELESIAKVIFQTMSPANANYVNIPELRAATDPLKVYPNLLNKTLIGRQSRVHGDLHPRNVLVDQFGRGWLIDFAKVTERHNMFDFIKLETYIRMMILAPLQVEFSWNEYVQFELALNADLPDQNVKKPTNAQLAKAYTVIRAIRHIAQKYMGSGADLKKEYFPALLLYCLAMLKYYKSHGTIATQSAFITAYCLTLDGIKKHELPQSDSDEQQNVLKEEQPIPASASEGKPSQNVLADQGSLVEDVTQEMPTKNGEQTVKATNNSVIKGIVQK